MKTREEIIAKMLELKDLYNDGFKHGVYDNYQYEYQARLLAWAINMSDDEFVELFFDGEEVWG